MSLLRVEDVTRTFARGRQGRVHAVNGVSFHVEAGETLALIGESGSGKSTMGRLALRLHDVDSGSVRYDGQDLGAMSPRQMRELRSEMAMVFQEPYQSLDPRMRVHQIVGEPLAIHYGTSNRAARAAQVDDALRLVSLSPSVFRDRYPHELSGGQQQRVGIARALVTRPRFVVLDEPTSSLDLSVRAQILQLLIQLKAELDLAYLFISHDIQTVEYISDRIAVMYFGRIVETGPTAEVFANPQHPYTKALLSATLSSDPTVQRRRLRLTGEVPSPTSLPAGCVLSGRCPVELSGCSTTAVSLREREPGHAVACLVGDHTQRHDARPIERSAL